MIDKFLEFVYIVPLMNVIVYLPFFILISIGHRKFINMSRISENHMKNITFRFHYANILITSGLYELFIVIILFSIQTSNSVLKNKILFTVSCLVFLGILLTVPVWYKNGSKILFFIYSLYIIFLLNPFWFVYTYFYLLYLLYKFVLTIDKSNLSIVKIIFYAVTIVLLLFLGSYFYYYWDFQVEPSLIH